MKSAILTLITSMLVLAACQGSNQPAQVIRNNNITSCESLKQHLEDFAGLAQNATRKVSEFPVFASVPTQRLLEDSASNLNGGLEEGDLYKVLGDRMLILDRAKASLRLLDIEQPDQPHLIAERDLGGEDGIAPMDLILLDSFQVVVIGHKIELEVFDPTLPSPDPSMPSWDLDGYRFRSGMSLLHIDLSSSDDLEVVSRMDTSTQYKTVRLQSPHLAKIIHSNAVPLGTLEYGSHRVELKKNSPTKMLGQAIGVSHFQSNDESVREALLCECDRFISRDSSSFRARSAVSITHLHNLSIEDGQLKLAHDMSIVGDEPELRANSEAFLLAFPIYAQSFDSFSLLQPMTFSTVRGVGTQLMLLKDNMGESKILGEASIDGGILNQFGLDYRKLENREIVNVFTTVIDEKKATTVSQLSTLELAKAGDLKLIHQIKDLGPGESLFANIFTQHRAYAVTSTMIVDPLFVFDFSNPAQPILTGELKVDGYASQIREISDRALFTIGRDEEDRPYVSLVSIDSNAQPRLEQQILYGSPGDLSPPSSFSWFGAEGYKSYLYDSVSGVLGVPVGRSWTDNHKVKFFRMEEDQITELGELAFQLPVERLIKLGQYYYSFGSSELAVSHQDSPAVELARISFED